MAAYEITTSQWDALLQENYVMKDIVDAINKATVFKSKIKSKRMSSGRRDIYPIMLGVHQGVGARGENTKLPAAGAGQYLDVILSSKYNYAQLYITGQSKEFSTRKAFVDFAMRSLKDTKEGLTLDLARQMWSDGTGTIALVDGGGNIAAGSTVITIKNAYGQAWGSLSTNTTFLMKKNMTVQFDTEDGNGNGYQIISLTATTITIAPPLINAVVDAQKIQRLGAKNQEVEGWLRMVATSSFMTAVLGLGTSIYHNIDRSVNSDFEGNVTDAGAAALTLAIVRNAKDALFRRGANASLCISNTNVTRDYELLLQAFARIVPATKLEYGATALEHDGLLWTKDKDAPVKAFSLVDTSEVIWAQRMEPSWKKQGDSIFRVVSGYDAEEATL
ncbi:MAG TPA: phage major capsid protein, partial [Gemmatimonadaceae bacterium]|nr:phage major capsid protein [Gemmatimonadaceae bacterium]